MIVYTKNTKYNTKAMKKRTNEKPKKQKMRKNTNTQKVNKPDK